MPASWRLSVMRQCSSVMAPLGAVCFLRHVFCGDLSARLVRRRRAQCARGTAASTARAARRIARRARFLGRGAREAGRAAADDDRDRRGRDRRGRDRPRPRPARTTRRRPRSTTCGSTCRCGRGLARACGCSPSRPSVERVGVVVVARRAVVAVLYRPADAGYALAPLWSPNASLAPGGAAGAAVPAAAGAMYAFRVARRAARVGDDAEPPSSRVRSTSTPRRAAAAAPRARSRASARARPRRATRASTARRSRARAVRPGARPAWQISARVPGRDAQRDAPGVRRRRRRRPGGLGRLVHPRAPVDLRGRGRS